ncbi:MAG: acyl-CoA dehydrogenase family protein [Spirochaetia bacterium]
MKFASFMESIYLGKPGKDNLFYRETPEDDPTVAKLVKAYKASMADYSPADMESGDRMPPGLLAKLKKIGFFGLIIPKEYGGLGLDLHQYIAIIERISGMDMAVGILALAHLSIGIKGILLFGNPEQKRKYLTPAASGKMIFCYALTEPRIGSDGRNITTTAEISPDGTYYTLNGSKTFITNANYAGGMTVFARLEGAPKGTLGAFIVERAWEGVSVGRDMPKMGLKASSTASIHFKNVRVPAENLLGQPGDGFKIAMTILNYGRLALGAASAGIMEVSYNDMVKRASSRVQFGRPIIGFELIREKLLRAYVEKEVIRAMTHFTAGFLEHDPVGYVAIESSHCKLYGTTRAWPTLYEAMQTAGGSGYLSTAPYEKRMRDFRVTTIFEGTTEIHSMYPPLSLARNLNKLLRHKNPLLRLLMLTAARFRHAIPGVSAGSLLRRIGKPEGGGADPSVRSPRQGAEHSGVFAGKTGRRFSYRALRNALRTARRGVRRFRGLFLAAVIRFGPRLPERELLLRRLTRISMHVYGILAVSAKIGYLRQQGRPTHELAAILDTFRLKAEREFRKNRNLRPDGFERRLMGLFHLLDRARTGEEQGA